MSENKQKLCAFWKSGHLCQPVRKVEIYITMVLKQGLGSFIEMDRVVERTEKYCMFRWYLGKLYLAVILSLSLSLSLFFFFFWPFLFFFRAAPSAYGSAQARGQIAAAAANLHHSHSNTGFEP